MNSQTHSSILLTEKLVVRGKTGHRLQALLRTVLKGLQWHPCWITAGIAPRITFRPVMRHMLWNCGGKITLPAPTCFVLRVPPTKVTRELGLCVWIEVVPNPLYHTYNTSDEDCSRTCVFVSCQPHRGDIGFFFWVSVRHVITKNLALTLQSSWPYGETHLWASILFASKNSVPWFESVFTVVHQYTIITGSMGNHRPVHHWGHSQISSVHLRKFSRPWQIQWVRKTGFSKTSLSESTREQCFLCFSSPTPIHWRFLHPIFLHLCQNVTEDSHMFLHMILDAQVCKLHQQQGCHDISCGTQLLELISWIQLDIQYL